MNKFPFTLTLLLISITCYSQREADTVRVVVLTSDTAHRYMEIAYGVSCKEVGCTIKNHNVIHTKTEKIVESFPILRAAEWQIAYSVREKHNTNEGRFDPYSEYGYVSRDYWVHVKYLTAEKKPFPNTVIIWQSVDAKK